MTDDLSELLHRTASALPDSQDRLGGVRRKRAQRRRRREQLVATTAVVALTAAAVTFYASLSRSAAPGPVSQPVGGQLYEATGRVVRVPGQPDRACAPDEISNLTLIIPPPPPHTCTGNAVIVEGVDFGTLSERFAKDGAVEGWATLRGVLRGGTLVVTRQSAPLQAQPAPGFTNPPCAPPTSGWPSQKMAGYNPNGKPGNLYKAEHPDEVSEISIARPTPHQALVYVLTYTDPAPVYAALRPYYGKSLCVVKSRYARAVKASVEADIRQHSTQLGIFGLVTPLATLDAAGELSYPVQVVRVTPEVRALLDRHPKGLIDPDPWLKEV